MLFLYVQGCGTSESASTDSAERSLEASARYVGDEDYEYSGCEVGTAGDVNGDGYADVVIGVNHESGSTLIAAVMFGSPEPASASISAADASFSDPEPVSGRYSSVAGVGDVNDDGFDDVLVGLVTACGWTGGAYLMLGAPHPGRVETCDSIAFTDDGSAPVLATSSAGDIDGDGHPDMLVATPGAAHLLWGGSTMSSGSLQELGVAFTPETLYSLGGRSVSGAGDVDGDGLEDMVFGTDGFEPPPYTIFYLVLGAMDMSSRPLEDSDSVVEATGEVREVSFVSAAGDVNGDGYSDVFLTNDRPYLVLGSGSPNWTSVADAAAAYEEGFYAARGVGDIDGDGFDDVGLGSWSAGRALLSYGSADPASMPLDSDVFVGAGGNIGASVGGGGDVNGDGLSDWLVGAPLEDDVGRSGAGATYLILGTGR